MILSSKAKTLIALAVAFVLLLTSYIIVVNVLSPDEDPAGSNPVVYTPPTLATGEYFSEKQGTLSLYVHHKVADVTSVSVYTGKTESGATGTTYTILRNKNNVLVLEGYEGLTLSSTVQSFFYSVCNPLTQKRITDGTQTNTVVYANGTTIPDAPLSQYGLGAEDDPASYTLTLSDGTSHKVYVGYPTPLRDGYYCRYEGRNEIYVMTNSFGAVKEGKEIYLTPTVVKTNANASLPFLDRFILFKDGNVKVDVKYEAEKYGTSTGEAITVRFTKDGAYDYIGNETLMNSIFSSYINLEGNRVLELIPRGWTEQQRQEQLPLLLEKYGISQTAAENPYVIVYGWDGMTKEELEDAGIEGVEGIDQTLIPLMFSERSNDNTYNVYCIITGSVENEEGKYESVLYEQVVEVDASLFAYLTSPTVAFVRQSVYSNNIANVGSLSFEGSYLDRNGVSHNVKESFTLNHRDNKTTDSSGKTELKDVYSVYASQSGLIMAEGQTTNFAMLYALFMSNPQYFGDISLTAQQQAALRAQGPLATITLTEVAREAANPGVTGALLTNPDGSVQIKNTYTYTYYRYSSTQAIISLDGGQTFGFVVSFAPLNELMENVARVSAGNRVVVSCANGLATLPGIVGQ